MLRNAFQKFFGFFALMLAFSCLMVGNAWSQAVVPGWGWFPPVAGVAIDPNGMLATANFQMQSQLAAELQRNMQAVPSDLDTVNPLRKISMKKLDELIQQSRANNQPIPEEAQFLGGLLAINYIVVVPEENDVLLVGPAEGWVINGFGAVVGRQSGAPVLRLEDLITLFRSWPGNAPFQAIYCSIDPTPEGLARVRQLENSGAKYNMSPGNYAAALERAYGINEVTIGGVPADSRIANVIVAADYRMKRICLGHEPALIPRFATYPDLIPAGGAAHTSRFWLAADNATITHDEAKLTWNLSGVRVKTLSEAAFVASQGGGLRAASGGRDIPAERWAAQMTERYTELAKANPIFAELQNCMDLAMVVALIQRERLVDRANGQFVYLTGANTFPLPTYATPRHVRPESVVVQKGPTSFVIAAGGVELNPFESVANAHLDENLQHRRPQLTTMTGTNWFSN